MKRLLSVLAPGLLLWLVCLPFSVRAQETSSFSVPEIITQAAERHNVSASWLQCVAWQESSWRPWVTSPAGHRGLFQFSDQTWAWSSAEAGLGGASPYDASAASEVAAYLFGTGRSFHWPTARRCA